MSDERCSGFLRSQCHLEQGHAGQQWNPLDGSWNVEALPTAKSLARVADTARSAGLGEAARVCDVALTMKEAHMSFAVLRSVRAAILELQKHPAGTAVIFEVGHE